MQEVNTHVMNSNNKFINNAIKVKRYPVSISHRYHNIRVVGQYHYDSGHIIQKIRQWRNLNVLEVQTCCQVGFYWISVLSVVLCFFSFLVLCLLALCQPTLLLHTQPTASYAPSSPARCTQLARNLLNIDKCCGAHRQLTSTYVHLPTGPNTGPHRHAPLKRYLFKKRNKTKTNTVPTLKRPTFNRKSVSHQMPCLPTLWKPTQWLCVQPSLNSSPTCLMNWRGNIWSENIFCRN